MVYSLAYTSYYYIAACEGMFLRIFIWEILFFVQA